MPTTHINPLHTETKRNPLIITLLWICRIFVGGLFIFSGFIKANDPIGFSYKLEEYFLVFNLSFLNSVSVWISIFLCALEIIFGSLLILGSKGKKVAWGLLLLIIFFTFLTFYSAFFEVVTSCGCFGDAIPLTPWQSFLKDLVLLAFIIFIFIHREKIKPLIQNGFTRGFVSFGIVLISFGIGIYTYNYLPFMDFLPYKVGNNIPEQMVLPEGEEPDKYEHIYTLKNKNTDEEKEVSDKVYMDEEMWEDEDWEIVGDPKTKLVKKGYEIPIADLFISDNEGMDVTEEVLSEPYPTFLVVSTKVEEMGPFDIKALDKINQTVKELSSEHNLRAIFLSASSTDEVYYLNEQLDFVLETNYADAVPLKSMVRSNPGVLLLQNGNILNKWSKKTFPNIEELKKKYFNH